MYFAPLLWVSRVHWKYSWRRAVGSFFSALGITWTVVRFSFHYFPQIAEVIFGPWWIVVLPPIAFAAIRSRPILHVEHQLNFTDVRLEIKVGNILTIPGSLVVGTNTTFDTSILDNIISPDSLQGQFTREYYDAVEHLNTDLENSLQSEEFTKIYDNRKGKANKYANGTVAKIKPRGRVVYLVAIADMNEHGNASSSRERVLQALSKLWQYIGERGDMGEIAVPILGTGRSRITGTRREEMIREIIRSFIAASSERKFCDKLTIVISEKDYRHYEIDLDDLGRYLYHCCRYTHLHDATAGATGEVVY